MESIPINSDLRQDSKVTAGSAEDAETELKLVHVVSFFQSLLG